MTDEESKAVITRFWENGGGIYLARYGSRLREQGFDSVLILCTKYDDKNGKLLDGHVHAALWVEDQKTLHCKKDLEE